MTETLTTAERYTAAMREREMESAIRELVERRHGKCFSIRDSRGFAVEGMPDLIILAPWINAVVFAELKSQSRNLTPGQEEVIAMLAECRWVETMVVRPIPRDGECGYDTFIGYLSS